MLLSVLVNFQLGVILPKLPHSVPARATCAVVFVAVFKLKHAIGKLLDILASTAPIAHTDQAMAKWAQAKAKAHTVFGLRAWLFRFRGLVLRTHAGSLASMRCLRGCA